MKQHALPTLMVSLILTACGGGGAGGSLIDPDSPLADGESDWCELDYYENLIGTYRGLVDYEIPALERSCQWDMEVEITGRAASTRCTLTAVTRSTVEQRIVPASGSGDEYQCFSENAIRQVSEPHVSLSEPELYDEITYPVRIGILGDSSVPTFGSYFGDTSERVLHVHLFDSPSNYIDVLLKDDAPTLEFVANDVVVGTLTRQ